jgi:thiosulfate/3-mercaptopyruvate sulfurtransferase
MVSLFSGLGIGAGTQVVTYDAAYGSIAARLWWMLQYMGHRAAAVLDGGWQAWSNNRLPVEQKLRVNRHNDFIGKPETDWLVSVAEVPAAQLLIDAREPERYRGEVEPIDPVAGHIPGAVNHYWKLNLTENGSFHTSAKIREALTRMLAGTEPGKAVFYCGSGVTACHNLLAVRHAGLAMPRLYAGSWSEWCRDVSRPVARG